MPSSATQEVGCFLKTIREGFLTLQSIGFGVCCQVFEASKSKDGESVSFDSIASKFGTELDALEKEFNTLNEQYFATHKHYYRIQQSEKYTETITKGPSTEKFREELEAISEKMQKLTHFILTFIPQNAKSKKEPKSKRSHPDEAGPSKRAEVDDDRGIEHDECSNDSETSLEAVIGDDELPPECSNLIITEFEEPMPVRVKRESAESLGLVLAAAERVVMKVEPGIKMEYPPVDPPVVMIKPEPMVLVPSAEEGHSTSMATDADTDMDSFEQEVSVTMDDDEPVGPLQNTVEQLTVKVTPEGPAGCSYYI